MPWLAAEMAGFCAPMHNSPASPPACRKAPGRLPFGDPA